MLKQVAPARPRSADVHCAARIAAPVEGKTEKKKKEKKKKKRNEKTANIQWHVRGRGGREGPVCMPHVSGWPTRHAVCPASHVGPRVAGRALVFAPREPLQYWRVL